MFPTILTETHADPLTQPFWDAAQEDRLVGAEVHALRHVPPAAVAVLLQLPVTRRTSGSSLPGTGTIYSFTVVRHPLHPDLADACPYVSGVVELDGTQGAGRACSSTSSTAIPTR